MNDLRVSQYAALLVQHSMQVREGDKVLIRGGIAAAPLMEELARYVLKAGGFPYVLPSWEALNRLRISEASEKQLSTVTDLDQMLMTGIDCTAVIRAPDDMSGMGGVDPAKLLIQSRAVQPYMRHLINHARWVTCNYPCRVLARDAGMTLDAYADFVYRACLVDWKASEAYMNRVKAIFDAGDTVHITGSHTDLTFRIGKRPGVLCAGIKNMPDGEVFYAPVEDSAEGHITYDFPAIYQGHEVDGVRLQFSGGQVVHASAKKGEAVLLQMLETDPGARRLGEFGIGCNFNIDRFSKDILFDEKIGGTIHLALGRSYDEAGGSNQSAIHWDMIKDLRRAGKLELDGRVVRLAEKFIEI